MILEGVRAHDGEGGTARASGEADIVQRMDLVAVTNSLAFSS